MEQRDMIRMANQIASFFNGSGPEQAVKDAAEHINKFWDPRMRAELLEHLARAAKASTPPSSRPRTSFTSRWQPPPDHLNRSSALTALLRMAPIIILSMKLPDF